MNSDGAPEDAGLEPLVAYLQLPRHAGEHTRQVLEGHVHSFADREGFRLHRFLVGAETTPPRDTAAGQDDAGVRALIDCLQMDGIRTVLVIGPARHALLALHQLRGVRVLTLAHVRPAGDSRSLRTATPRPGGSGRASRTPKGGPRP